MTECPHCHGDGRDPYNDYLLPGPECGGEGHFEAWPDDDDDDYPQEQGERDGRGQA